jgi:very-short-patch-repair endonuclease
MGEGLLDKAYDRTPTLRSRELRNNPTPAEKKLWSVLSNRQIAGIRFNRQVAIRPFICDFVARTHKLIIELDGGQHALNADADANRSKFLESRGYRVIRFWNNEVLENIDGVVTVIEQALADRPSPTPPGNGRGF